MEAGDALQKLTESHTICMNYIKCKCSYCPVMLCVLSYQDPPTGLEILLFEDFPNVSL